MKMEKKEIVECNIKLINDTTFLTNVNFIIKAKYDFPFLHISIRKCMISSKICSLHVSIFLNFYFILEILKRNK
jgi:hypothetical protein